MRYRIGEVAEFFGLTKEAIRYYERRGIIRAARDEATGYRVYPREAITRLKEIRMYESLGFTLSEAQAMTTASTYGEMARRLDEKIDELRVKAEALEAMQARLRSEREAMRAHAEGRIAVRTTPEAYFLRYVRDEASARREDERERIARSRIEEKAWVDAMPPVVLGALHYDADMRPVEGVYGSLVTRADAERLALPLEAAVRLPPRLCVVALACSGDSHHPDPTEALAYIRAHGYAVCGEVYAVKRFNFIGEDGAGRVMHEMFIPVRAQAPHVNKNP